MKGGVETRAQRQARLQREQQVQPRQPTPSSSSSSSKSTSKSSSSSSKSSASAHSGPSESVVNKMKEAKLSSSSSASDRSGPSQVIKKTTKSKRKTVKKTVKDDFTDHHCKAFFNNPFKNPLTGAPIVLGGVKYEEILEKCKEIMPEVMYETYVSNMSEKLIEKTFTDDKKGKDKCIYFVNESRYNQHIEKVEVRDIFKPKRIIGDYKRHPFVSQDDPVVKKILERCDQQFFIKLLQFKFYNDDARYEDDQKYIYIPVKYYTDDAGNVRLQAMAELFGELIYYIISMKKRNFEIKKELFNDIYKTVKILLDSPREFFQQDRFFGDDYEKLQELLFELEALRKGIEIEREEFSSDMRSSNRSRSKSVPEGLAPLSKKTRTELLKELEAKCIEMKDTISYDDFEDMKKKKLQLVIQIGKPIPNGKRQCYYVKNIYDHIVNAKKSNLPIEDPLKSQKIDAAMVDEIILPKMRYIKPGVTNPLREERAQYPKIDLHILPFINQLDGRLFHLIKATRKIMGEPMINYSIGIIPDNIYKDNRDRANAGRQLPTDIITNTEDLSSGTLLIAIRELYDQGRLFDNFGEPSVIWDSDPKYWDNDILNKAVNLNRKINALR